MSFLTIDIETAPQPRFLDPDQWCWNSGKGFEPAKDWELDGEPWEAWTDEGTHDVGALDLEVRESRVPLKGTGVVPSLHPTTCQVVQVSYGYRRTGDITVDVCQIDRHPDEKALLTEALSILASAAAKGTRIVSFNGKQFDLPVLRARAALLRMPVPQIPWRKLLYPYADDRHADLRLILSADDRRARGTLQWWATAFGIYAEEHGAEVAGWVQRGEWETLRRYGAQEGKTLIELFEAVVGIL